MNSVDFSEICYGPMKSGKSRYLVQKAEALYQANIPFLAFKPEADTRDGHFIRSRDTECRDIQAIGVSLAEDILEHINAYSASPKSYLSQVPALLPDNSSLRIYDYLTAHPIQACLLDEVFLLDSKVLSVMTHLKSQGIRIYLSGLDRDFRREYFPLKDFDITQITMQNVIEACDQSVAMHAQCEVCNADAAFSQRLLSGKPAHYDSPIVLIGDEEYQPRCAAHHEVIGHPHPSLSLV